MSEMFRLLTFGINKTIVIIVVLLIIAFVVLSASGALVGQSLVSAISKH